jgi:2-amino-4-hydroxy-6-hydroxymethyldihydropteridine diphosphokinase
MATRSGDPTGGAPPARAAIALGSNLGDRHGYLRGAVDALSRLGTVIAVSPLYETAPVGGPDQGPYLNAVVVVETAMEPRQLLSELHGLERAAGRTRDLRWGPRTLDLDLILYGSRSVDEHGLEVPHPRFRDRRFVLEPLLAAWPDAAEPDGTALAPLLATVADQDLTKVADPSWASEPPRGRGAGWVAGQIAMLAVHVAALGLAPGSLGGSVPGMRAVGAALTLGSVALFLASGSGLGRMLTPYPQPIDDGTLVTRGIYGMVRHPMYGSVLLLAFASATWARSLPAVGTAAALAVFFTAKSSHEESRLAAVYPEYPDYRARVKRRFIPWVV